MERKKQKTEITEYFSNLGKKGAKSLWENMSEEKRAKNKLRLRKIGKKGAKVRWAKRNLTKE